MFKNNPSLCSFGLQLIFFFRKAVLRKLVDIRFSYKHCNFSHVCLLVKMASKTVTRSIKLNRSHFVASENLKNIRLNRIYSYEYSYDIWSDKGLLKIQKEIIFFALTKAITLLRNSLGWFVERESMQKQLPSLTSLMNTNTTPQCRADICSTLSGSKTNLADCDREETRQLYL